MHTVGFQQFGSLCSEEQLDVTYGGKFMNFVSANKCTLVRCDILDTGKSSMATTTPSWSRKPATTRGTPGRNDWAHHLSNLNLMVKSPQWGEMTLDVAIVKPFDCSSSAAPVKVAALFGSADLRRSLQLHVARRRRPSADALFPTVHLTRKQKSVIGKPGLNHSAESLVGVHHPAWVG